MADRFLAEPALRPLKSFQRATVDYVSRRLLTDPDSVRRFLVADEVGLGKTMVARGVIAKTIETLQDSVPRIDIIYICSNGAIAKQNVNRLNVMQEGETRPLPTRLTLLALELARAGGIKKTGVNFFSLTPGTSLDIKQGGGLKEERALLLRLIRPLLTSMERRVLGKLLRYPAGKPGWKSTRKFIDHATLEPLICKRFQVAVAQRTDLLADIRDLVVLSESSDTDIPELRRRTNVCVMELRKILAHESAEALEPDLIVLDEFQRFTELLRGHDDAAELARRLFDAKDPDGNLAKVLLLSATPYRMLSLKDDDAGAGDHYREFLEVLKFLFGAERGADVCREIEIEMGKFRLALQSLPGGFSDADWAKKRIESRLREVIARTERVSETAERDAMMRDVEAKVTVEAEDLLEARSVARVAEAAGAPGTVEYWKSAPYLLNFLRDYKLGKCLEEQFEAPNEALLAAIRNARHAQIDLNAVRDYRQIPLNNGRMRALREIAFRDQMARRLWMPPSLPYFGETVRASKLLVFSQWTMVPDAIAALLSYESEREMGMGAVGREYSARHHQLLNFRKNNGRLTGLRALPLVLPSPSLAATVDPLALRRNAGVLADASAMRRAAQEAVEPLARSVAAKLVPPRKIGLFERLRGGHAGAAGEHGGEQVANWDWAVAAFLDTDSHLFVDWLRQGRILSEVIRDDGQDAWTEHLAALSEAATAKRLFGSTDSADLRSHLVDLALGSPATCALRALHRIAPDLPLDDPTLMNAAARVGMAFRSLFNQPESQALLRKGSEDAYWQSVLGYCIEFDLQSVLDEYVHVLLEAEGLTDKPVHEAVAGIAATMDEALSLKPASIEIKTYKARRGRISVNRDLHMRGRFATRLLQKASEDSGVQRTDTVRTAFNSPFRPFVLASTSVGQEGLDFHPWCHRLVHWNLPSNPVDLEQREGRIHRYKNHAVRLNLAQNYRSVALAANADVDPWQAMFAAAHKAAERPGELEPFWLLDGRTCIERIALSLPFSREKALIAWLKSSVAIYRLAFGQPRQDDLLSFLASKKDGALDLDISSLQISLRPLQN